MTQPTQNPDYLSVLLAGTQAASQRDAWKARCEALQAELVTQEVRHREEVAGLQADLEDMSAQRQHWVRVAHGEMARRGEVKEDTAKERDWYRRALAKAHVEVRRLTEKMVETQAERDQLRATATAWVRVSRRVWHKGASEGELADPATVNRSDAAPEPRTSEQGENAADAQEPTGDGNAPWTLCPEYLELGRVSYAVWCVSYADHRPIPLTQWWSWSALDAEDQLSWAYVACCNSASPAHAREHAQALRQKYADNAVFQHAIR